MAIRYLSKISALAALDLNKTELQNAVIQNLATPPGTPLEGQIYFDSSAGDKSIYFWDGTNWVDVGGGVRSITAGAGLTSTGSRDITLNVGQGVGIQVNPDSVQLNHLGLENLTDPNADRIYFWDDSVGYSDWLEVDGLTGITISGNILKLFGVPNSALTNSSVTVSAGAGLVDGGTVALGGSVTLNVGAGLGINVDVDDVSIKNINTVTNNNVPKWNTGPGQFENSLISDDGTTVTIAGNLTVGGTTTYVNSTTVEIGDNIILLNRNETAAPSQNAGFEVERGTSANVSFIWNETQDYFSTVDQQFHIGSIIDTTAVDASQVLISDNGIVKKADASDILDLIVIAGETGTASPSVGNFTIAAGEGIDTTASGSTITISGEDASETNKGIVELATSAETIAGTSTTLAVHPAGLQAAISGYVSSNGYAASVGDGTNTVYAVNHNLSSRDVIVQVYDNATYDTVHVDTVRTSIDTVTLTFASAPSLNAYRVIIQKI